MHHMVIFVNTWTPIKLNRILVDAKDTSEPILNKAF